MTSQEWTIPGGMPTRSLFIGSQSLGIKIAELATERPSDREGIKQTKGGDGADVGHYPSWELLE